MRKSIQLKMIFSFSMIVLIACIVISITSYMSSVNLVKDSLSTVAGNIASRAVEVIDIKKYQEITVESRKTDYYHELRSELNELREKTGLLYLYTMSRKETNNGYEYYYVVDGMPINDNTAAKLGQKEADTRFYPQMGRAFETGKRQIEMTNTEDYGRLITSYIPIKSDNGEVIGIIGADFDASKAYQVMRGDKIKLILLTLVILLVSLFVIFFFTRYLVKPLKQLTNQVEKIKSGDLSSSIETNLEDEIGVLTRAFQGMANDLRKLIEEIHNDSRQLVATSGQLLESTNEVKAGSQQIVASIQEISAGADIQSQSAEEGVQVMEDMAAGIQHSKSASSEVSEQSSLTLAEAEKGYAKILDVVSHMNDINQSVEQSGNAIKTLEVRSSEVSEIMNVIQSISSQTNLLALNASIEAARAGEYGRGFAVVAEEVRNLAEQSANSAKEVSDLIAKINHDTAHSVETMDVVVERVKSGIIIVQEAGEAFQTILAAIQDIVCKIQEVSAASEQMSAASEEIVASVAESAKIAEQSAYSTKNVVDVTVKQNDSIHDMSSSIDSLSKMAEQLNELVRNFKL
ncbi:methyl-accepting chemotaxis protein [Paenibacillus caui]|uniref:methyl-accepting chemotaxis protein n=1 Tax=Paenibacillus caui TaxID=2873927 RepID=UPI001CA9ECD4|nr:methyl-accepting chemotaxis protein [Paenibacillus caui]